MKTIDSDFSMTKPILTFKNNLPNLTVLNLFSTDLSALEKKLQQTVKQAPMMFVGMQLIIDISAFDSEPELDLDLNALIERLRQENINPIAIMSNKLSRLQKMTEQGVGILPVLKTSAQLKISKESQASDASVLASTELKTLSDTTKADKKMAKELAAEKAGSESISSREPRKTYEQSEQIQPKEAQNQIIRHPVRSGQRLYCRGDLIIIGSVSPGAEVIADGSIHVYGKLSGRAIAGARGDEKAAIFCQNLNAELVSIAGNYKQLEDIESNYLNQPMQILLEDEKICFFSL